MDRLQLGHAGVDRAAANVARMFADRIVGLRQGQVVFDGTAAQLTEEAQSALYAKSSPANMGSQFDSPSQSKEFLPC